MHTMWSKLIMTLALALGVVVYPQYIGLEIDGALTLNYKTGDDRPVVYYLSVRNTGTQQANFYIKTDVDWVFVYREGQNNSTSVHIAEGVAVNFILEIHPELISDGSHKAKITITADHLREPITFSAREIALTFNKNVKIETVTPTASVEPPSVTLSITPIATPEPTAEAGTPTPSRLPLFSPTPKKPSPSIIHPAISPTPEVEPPTEVQPQKTPTPLLKPGGEGEKSFWRILKNIFGWFF